MKISEKSWHYRLNDFFAPEFGMPETLCWYFWRTVICTIAAALMAIVGGGLALGLTIGLPISYYSWLVNGSSSAPGFAIFITLFDLFLLWLWFDKQINRVVDKVVTPVSRFIDRRKTSGFTAVIWEYLRAAKQKVCPLIEYTEE